MNTPLFHSLHHIAIICSDYEKSKAFYTHILGFRILRETYRKGRGSYKLDLVLGNNYLIELFSFPHPPRRQSGPEACGLRHLAFTVENLEKTIHWLEQNNVLCEPVRQDEWTQKKFTFFFDPDQLPIEMVEK